MANELSKRRSPAGTAPADPGPDVPDYEADDLKSYKRDIDDDVARSLGRELQLLTNDFWRDVPASIENIKLRKNGLTLSVRLPFLSPPPSRESGDRPGTQKEVDEIRSGFAEFVRGQQPVRRRLAGFFYSEFHTFLLGYCKIYRFNKDIRKRIKPPGERRLAGRPALPIPPSQKRAVKQQARTIFAAVLEMREAITRWKRKQPSIKQNTIQDRLTSQYDCERYPWTRYAFLSVTMSAKPENQTRASIAEPEKWSCPDIAAQWTQDWFHGEYGHKYDLREIRKLIQKS
jgi:hypothetical protein